MFLATIKEWLDSIFAAFKAARAEKAAEDVASTKPLVDHADDVDAEINAEIAKFSTQPASTAASASAASAKKPS